jgi:glycosyltransferase involved in cell wall biosynthesis
MDINDNIPYRESSNTTTMAKPSIGILNSSSIAKSYGGIAPFIKNLDPFLRKDFDLTYITLPDRLYKISLIPHRLLYVLYLLTKRGTWKKMDLIISHVPEGSWVISFGKVPFVHIFHGNTNPMAGSRYWYGKYFHSIFRAMEKRIIRKASLVYTVGTERPGIPKIINPVHHSISIKETSLRKGFIFSGRLEKMKNIDRIIRVYASLDSSIRQEHPLYIAGTGTQETALKKLSKDLQLNGQVVFLGNLKNEDLIEADSSKKILLMASSFEGFPMAIAEAFSLGVPVVSTAVGDISRFVRHDQNGILLPVEFLEEEYANGIVSILNDYERFASNALASSKPFSAEKITAELTGDIKSFLEKP